MPGALTGADELHAFRRFAVKVVVVHTATYLLFGLLMSNLFDYGKIFQQEIIRSFMRPLGSSEVMAGPLLQPVRGLLFAVGLWPLRRLLLEHRRGWLVLWGIFLVFGILGTPAAAPSSLEGVIYSRLPLWYHLLGLPEIALQTLAFSWLLIAWERRPAASSGPGPTGAWRDLLKAVMLGSFAYMGYAVGSVTAALLAGATIDVESAASDWKSQGMFVAAFVVNVLLVFLFEVKGYVARTRWWQRLLLFWVVDAAVPWVYGALIAFPLPWSFALQMGFLPALVIALGLGRGRV